MTPDAPADVECNACVEPERYDDHLCKGGFGGHTTAADIARRLLQSTPCHDGCPHLAQAYLDAQAENADLWQQLKNIAGSEKRIAIRAESAEAQLAECRDLLKHEHEQALYVTREAEKEKAQLAEAVGLLSEWDGGDEEMKAKVLAMAPDHPIVEWFCRIEAFLAKPKGEQ